ncbi:propanediol utilization protein, partial [Escherichia coli]|nr:propanediol utilization protein [Escherichia coli]
GDVRIGFIDRFSGSVVLTGDVSSVESALQQVVYSLHEILDFSIPKITRS